MKFALVLLFMLIPSPTWAQGSLLLYWDHPDLTPTVAQSATFRYYLNNDAGQILEGARCSLINSVTVCNAPFIPPTNGTHVLSITVDIAGYGESGRSNTITFRWPGLAAPHITKIIRS